MIDASPFLPATSSSLLLAARRAKDVVSLRGSIKQTYASDEMSKKLYATLLECQATGGHSRTYGALDPVQATLMAPHLTSIYVSGWQSSSTASTSNEPGEPLLLL